MESIIEPLDSKLYYKTELKYPSMSNIERNRLEKRIKE